MLRRLIVSIDASTLPPDVTHALSTAFGREAMQVDAVLKGGLSGAMLLPVTVAGIGYVVKRNDPARTGHEARAAREIACLTIASERGVAPRLAYADATSGISIVERIDGAQFGQSALAPSQRLQRAAETARRLHGGPAFPRGLTVAGAAAALHTMLNARKPGAIPESLVHTLADLERATQRYAFTAPCHHDLNPSNILDAPGAMYFVDWDSAGQSDPFVDLAQLGVFAFPAPAQRDELLEAYLGRSATGEERARATIARVMALGFYAAGFFLVAAFTGAAAAPDEAPLPMGELLATLGKLRDRAPPRLVAISLLEEMRRESTAPECDAARRALRAV